MGSTIDNSYIGEQWKDFDIDTIISEINSTEYGASGFSESLRETLNYIKKDASITDVRWASYLLGTAFAESNYSLQRWEADYVCGLRGKAYSSNGPCSSALSYFRSEKGGKKNYYDLGVAKNGLPYFGRGLIQLTGKDNYKKFGDIIGEDLFNNPDLALDNKVSYKVAVAYMNKRGVFNHVSNGDLRTARKRVNGGAKGLDEVNGAYQKWLDLLNTRNS